MSQESTQHTQAFYGNFEWEWCLSSSLRREERESKRTWTLNQSQEQSLLAELRAKHGTGDISDCMYGGLGSLLSSGLYSSGHKNGDCAFSTHVGNLSSFGLAFLGNPGPEGVTVSQVYLRLDGRNEIEREGERERERAGELVSSITDSV